MDALKYDETFKLAESISTTLTAISSLWTSVVHLFRGNLVIKTEKKAVFLYVII